jgi:peptidoglycan hydrolase-like protein with peptidoglycan-binding domain
MGDEPRLERGHSGEWVSYLQQCLEHQGYGVTANGQFDDALESTVRQFQSAWGLTADGVVDTRTWDALVRGTTTSADGGSSSEAADAVDERMLTFDVAAYPLLAELSGYGEGEDAALRFLTDRGVDRSFAEALQAAS